MADKTDRVTIIADNVAHVKLLPQGQTQDDVIQKFWERRARQKLEREAQRKPHAVAAPEIQVAIGTRDIFPEFYKVPEPPKKLPEKFPESPEELPEISGPGPCPYCGETYKRRDTHIRFCPQRPAVD